MRINLETIIPGANRSAWYDKPLDIIKLEKEIAVTLAQRNRFKRLAAHRRALRLAASKR